MSCLEQILDNVTDEMIWMQNFESIEYQVLLRKFDHVTLSNLIYDGGVLLNKRIVKSCNTIMEESVEYISFVFDELRDYYLAKRILSNNPNNIYTIIDNMIGNVSAPLEGVLKYIYEHYKSSFNHDECKYILNKYGNIKSEHSHSEEYSIGLELILGSGYSYESFEIEYLVFALASLLNSESAVKCLAFILDSNLNESLTNAFVDRLLDFNEISIAIAAVHTIWESQENFGIYHRGQDVSQILCYMQNWDQNRSVPLSYQRLLSLMIIVECSGLKENESFGCKSMTIRKVICDNVYNEKGKKLVATIVSADLSAQEIVSEYVHDIVKINNESESNYKSDGWSSNNFYFKKWIGIKTVFSSFFHVKRGSYIGEITDRLFIEFYQYSYNLHLHYFKYYRREFRSYYDFLKQRHKYLYKTASDLEDIRWRCKEIRYTMNHHVADLLNIESVNEVFKRYFGGVS